MIWLVKNAAGACECVFAGSEKEARQRSSLSNARGKKADLEVRPKWCDCPQHMTYWRDLSHLPPGQPVSDVAVAFVGKAAMCAACIARVKTPLDQRVADLEERVSSLEEEER